MPLQLRVNAPILTITVYNYTRIFMNWDNNNQLIRSNNYFRHLFPKLTAIILNSGIYFNFFFLDIKHSRFWSLSSLESISNYMHQVENDKRWTILRYSVLITELWIRERGKMKLIHQSWLRDITNSCEFFFLRYRDWLQDERVVTGRPIVGHSNGSRTFSVFAIQITSA